MPSFIDPTTNLGIPPVVCTEPRRLRAQLHAAMAARYCVALSLALASLACAQAQRLFFSKYIDTTSTNVHALEIFNPSCASVNLDEFRILLAPNGGNWQLTSGGIALSSVVLGALSSYVICTSSPILG
jgi:predicted extracellular nuclease